MASRRSFSRMATSSSAGGSTSPYGVEAQFFQNGDFIIGRRFDARLDSSRPPRELAIAWAQEWRKGIEQGDGGASLHFHGVA